MTKDQAEQIQSLLEESGDFETQIQDPDPEGDYSLGFWSDETDQVWREEWAILPEQLRAEVQALGATRCQQNDCEGLLHEFLLR